MRTLIAGLFTAALFVGCNVDTGEDPLDEGGGDNGGGSGGQSSGGKSAASGSSNAGTAPSAGTGGSTGSAGKGTSGDTGSGGSAVSGSGGKGSGGAGSGGKGSGGGSLGGAGSSNAGSSNAGSSNAGSSGEGAQSGSGGTSTAGTGSGGNAGSGGGECTENLGCELDAPPSTGDLHQDCVDRINQFRTECACMPPLERWVEGEDCADEMSEYDSVEDEAHAGFRDDICSGGSAQNECPGYRSNTQVIELCLQQMWDEGPPPQDPCEGDCFQTYGHFINMTNERYTKVACGFFTTPGGEVWSVQNFSR